MRPEQFLNATTRELLRQFGLNLRTARQRRGRPIKEWAVCLSVSESTLKRMEAGDPGVSMGAYVAALHVIDPRFSRGFAKLVDPAVDLTGIGLESVRKPKRIRRAVRKSDYAVHPNSI